MKTIINTILFVMITNICFSQADTMRVKLEKILANYSIPDLPAFKAIGFEPSNILRPSSPKALSIILPQFVNNGGFSLPQSFATEIAPFLLFKRKKLITLTEYKAKRPLMSLRVSLGINGDSTQKQPKATKLGLGLRMTLVDRTEVDFSDAYVEAEREIMKRLQIEEINLLDEFKESKGLTKADILTAEQKKEFDAFKKAKAPKLDAKELDAKFLELREKAKKDLWNKEKLDIAFAYVTRSADQVVSNFTFNKLAFWSTYAHPLFKNHGQLLIGANTNRNVTSENQHYWDANANARVFLGKNQLKGYFEVQFTANEMNKKNSLLGFLGAEYNISDGVWLNGYIGLKNVDSKTLLISNIDLKFTLPEKK